MPCRPSTSHSSTFCPAPARASARAAATVDFPVPPLPVTMCRRTSGKSRLGTTGSLVRRLTGRSAQSRSLVAVRVLVKPSRTPGAKGLCSATVVRGGVHGLDHTPGRRPRHRDASRPGRRRHRRRERVRRVVVPAPSRADAVRRTRPRLLRGRSASPRGSRPGSPAAARTGVSISGRRTPTGRCSCPHSLDSIGAMWATPVLDGGGGRVLTSRLDGGTWRLRVFDRESAVLGGRSLGRELVLGGPPDAALTFGSAHHGPLVVAGAVGEAGTVSAWALASVDTGPGREPGTEWRRVHLMPAPDRPVLGGRRRRRTPYLGGRPRRRPVVGARRAAAALPRTGPLSRGVAAPGGRRDRRRPPRRARGRRARRLAVVRGGHGAGAPAVLARRRQWKAHPVPEGRLRGATFHEGRSTSGSTTPSGRCPTPPDRPPTRLDPGGVDPRARGRITPRRWVDGQGRGECGRRGRRHPGRRDPGGRRVRAVRGAVGADRRGARGRASQRPRGGVEQLWGRRVGSGPAAHGEAAAADDLLLRRGEQGVRPAVPLR